MSIDIRLTSPGVYLITDDRLPYVEMIERTRQALAAGVRVLQYREKRATKRVMLRTGEALKQLCVEHGALFIVNDHLDVALALGADCLHVGQDDFPPARARELMPASMALGLSVSAIEEAVEGEQLGVDYLGVGAMYPTDTKTDAEYGGLGLLRAVREAVRLPLVAVGGIGIDRAEAVIAAGADAVAVVSAVYGAGHSGQGSTGLLDAIARARRSRSP